MRQKDERTNSNVTLRTALCWLGMLARYVGCEVCQTFSNNQQKQRMVANALQGEHAIHALIHSGSWDFLINVDCYSNFIEIDKREKATSQQVIMMPRKHLARDGIP